MIIDTQRIVERLSAIIEAAPVDPMPSDNIYMENLFEPEIYAALIGRLPHADVYEFIEHPDAKLPDGTRTRKLLDLTDESIERIQPQDREFWREMNKVFTAPILQKAIITKFYAKIHERFGDYLPELLSVPVFYKDYPGYFISVHPDSPVKVATFQFYLPPDESQIHLGTSFHTKEGNQYPLLKTNAFKPNSGYAFARTDYSWHSVLPMGPHEKERNTLALTIYIKGKEYKSKGYV